MADERNGNVTKRAQHENLSPSGLKNDMDERLDRIMGVTTTTTETEDGLPNFISSLTWKGSKKGYYFGTTKERGTGYHLDRNQKAENGNGAVGNKRQEAQRKLPEKSAASRKRRRIRFDESKNETKTFETEKVDSQKQESSQILLKQAEESVDPNIKVWEATQTGITMAVAALTKAIRRNALLRAQYPDSPQQYMDSELALHQSIESLSGLSTNPQLFHLLQFSDKLQPHISELLSHENVDIAMTTIHSLVEFIDPEHQFNDQQQQESKTTALESVLNLATQFVDSDCLELVIANLGRIESAFINNGGSNKDDQEKEQQPEEVDQQGINDVLSLVENLIDLDQLQTLLVKDKQPIAAWIVQKTSLLSWIFLQIQNGSKSPYFERCAEMLSLLFQQPQVHEQPTCTDLTKIPPYTSILVDDDDNDKKKKKKTSDKDKDQEIDGMEGLLQGIANFRKKQPATVSECELLENIIQSLDSALTFGLDKKKNKNVSNFLDAQGMELVLRCVRERVHAGGVALCLLDIADPNANHLLVQTGALKFLFPLFMKRQVPKPAPVVASSKKKKKQQAAKRDWLDRLERHLVHIFYNLTRFLPNDDNNKDKKIQSKEQSTLSTDCQRFMVKFIEKDCEKVDRLVELLLKYDDRARRAEYNFYLHNDDDDDDDNNDTREQELGALSAKLQGGGDLFHRLGAICAFVCLNSKRCRQHMQEQLSKHESGISLVKIAVQEFVAVLGDQVQKKQLQEYLANL